MTYRLGKPLLQVDTYAMVNLVAGRRVVPELIQDDFTPRGDGAACARRADRSRARRARAGGSRGGAREPRHRGREPARGRGDHRRARRRGSDRLRPDAPRSRSCVAARWLLPAALRATVLLPIEFRELVDASRRRSFTATSRTCAPPWIDGRRSIDTFVTVEADEYFKGGPRRVTHRPRARRPDRPLPDHLRRRARVSRRATKSSCSCAAMAGRVSIVGLSQGAFRVSPDRAAGASLTSPVLMAAAERRRPDRRARRRRRGVRSPLTPSATW